MFFIKYNYNMTTLVGDIYTNLYNFIIPHLNHNLPSSEYLNIPVSLSLSHSGLLSTLSGEIQTYIIDK